MSLKVSSKKCIKLVQPYTKEDLYNTIAYHLGVLDYLAKRAKELNEMSTLGVSKAKLSMDIINKCLEKYAPYEECEDGRNAIYVRMNKAYYTIHAIHILSNTTPKE